MNKIRIEVLVRRKWQIYLSPDSSLALVLSGSRVPINDLMTGGGESLT